MRFNLSYALQAFLACIAFMVFRLLPIDVSSAICGWVARIIGPFFRPHRIARTNLTRIMPELDEYQRRKILRDMWDNLGRAIGEYPHLNTKAMHARITIEGREHLEKAATARNGVICVSGHFANLEIIPLTAALCGLPLLLIYRPANNPIINWLLRTVRTKYNDGMISKGRAGAQAAIRRLKGGGALGMLIDQKMNEGIAVPFMGVPAMTAPALATLSVKYNAPVLLMRAVRTGGAHFHMTLLEPRYYNKSETPYDILLDIHQTFEGWIRAHPEQWFWVHNRWGFGIDDDA